MLVTCINPPWRGWVGWCVSLAGYGGPLCSPYRAEGPTLSQPSAPFETQEDRCGWKMRCPGPRGEELGPSMRSLNLSSSPSKVKIGILERLD